MVFEVTPIPVIARSGSSLVSLVDMGNSMGGETMCLRPPSAIVACTHGEPLNARMGSAVSHFFQSGSALLTANHRGCSDVTRVRIRTVFDALRANPRVTVQRLEGLLSLIPKSENILVVHNEEGYNLLQKVVAINNVDMLRWILSRNPDLNRGACSFPLHIACLRGHEDCVELLLKHGARVDVEARMCWPGPHNPNCEERGKHCIYDDSGADSRSSDKLQSAICYAIDGDQVDILELLMQQTEDHWLPWQQKRPLLHIACERGAWNCVKYLVSERSEEINQCYDEYYPIHQAALQPAKFLEILIQSGADINVCTQTGQLTLLHLVFLVGRKSTEDTLNTCKLLLDVGLRDLINRPDSLGNTPLHGLIVRYALEEARYPYDSDIQPWNKWDVLNIARYLLKNGASPSINQQGNSALACVLRHVRDWEFRYEMLNMLLQEGGDPNIVGRDGSVPLMVCLVPLINKDPLHHFTHNMKVCYLNCVKILLKHGANPNCSTRSNLTPLHVLVFSASEAVALGRDCDLSMEFIRSLLVLLLQHGLDTNIRISPSNRYILRALLDMVQSARLPTKLLYVQDLTLTFLQYGANPDVSIPVQTGKYETSPSASAFYRASGNSHPVLFHYVMMVAQKPDYMNDPEQRFASLIWLYYLSMSHNEVYRTLGSLLRAQEAGVIPVRATALFTLVKDIHSRPRTLKQMARLVIYQSLGHKPGLTVSKLSLPTSLKDYLLNFDP